MKNIIENNRLIAEFMNFEYDRKDCITDEQLLSIEDCRYHNSWDWIMPVVEKIEEETEFELVMYSNDCFWNKFGDRPKGLENEFTGCRRESVYNAVVSFIKNLQK